MKEITLVVPNGVAALNVWCYENYGGNLILIDNAYPVAAEDGSKHYILCEKPEEDK